MKIKQMAERLNSVPVRKKAKRLLALTLAVLLYAAVWLIALSGDTDFSAHGLLLTAGLFGGALLAGLLGRKRGKRQPDKRQSKERARAVPRRKRR